MRLSYADYRFHDLPEAAAQFAAVTGDVDVIPAGLPSIVEVHDALFVPLSADAQSSDAGRTGGLFDRDGRPVEASLLRRGAEVLSGARLPSPPPEPEDVIDEPVLYLGTFNSHFGHLLLEGMARCWALREPGLPHRIVMHALPCFPPLGYHHTLFRGLGLLPERLHFLQRPTRLRTVFVPHPAYVYNRLVHADVRHTYTGVLERLGLAAGAETDQPLWLSRAALDQGYRRAVDEAAFERVLERGGFCILRPEQHELTEQLAVVHRHRNVFGFWGSAFRLAWFSPRQKLTCHLGSEFPWPSFMMDRAVTGAEAWFVRASEHVAVGGEIDAFRAVQRLRTRALIDFLVAEGFLPRGTEAPAPAPESLLRREATYSRARHLAKVGDAKGLERLRTQLAAGPTEPAVHGALQLAEAEVFVQQRAWDRAIGCARAAVAADAVVAEAHLALGQALVGAGNRRAAAAALREALRLEPDGTEAALALAAIRPQAPDAKAALLAVLARDGAARPARSGLAELLLHGKRGAEAEAVLAAGVDLGPDRADARFRLATLQVRRGERMLAADTLRGALAIDAWHLSANVALAKILLVAGEAEKAVRHARLAVLLDPREARQFALLGRCLLAADDSEGAEAALREGLRLEPDRVECLYLLAVARQRQGHRAAGWQLRGHAFVLHCRRAAAKLLARLRQLVPD